MEPTESPKDVVAEAVLSMTGRLKLARRDGVTASGCAALTIEAGYKKSLADALNEWAEQNPSATIYEVIPQPVNADGYASVTILYSGEISELHKEVLTLYGQEINAKVIEMKKKRAAAIEEQTVREEKEAAEAARLVEVGRSYEKRLLKAKKLPHKERTKITSELDNGGMHFEVFFESMKKLMKDDSPNAKALQPLVAQLAKTTGVAKLLEMETANE